MPFAIGNIVAGADLTLVSTDKKFPLGARADGSDGASYEYVQADGAITQYQYVKIDDGGQAAPATTTLLPSTEPAAVGCAQVAFADNDYGWVVRKGPHTGKFAASCVQDVKIYTTGTAGVVDDSSTTLINGLKLITTITSAANSPANATVDMATVAA